MDNLKIKIKKCYAYDDINNCCSIYGIACNQPDENYICYHLSKKEFEERLKWNI